MKIRCKYSNFFVIQCKSDWISPNHFMFECNKYYSVFVIIHEDIETDIYYVGDMQMPMLRKTLEKYFDTTQLKRAEKLKKILE